MSIFLSLGLMWLVYRFIGKGKIILLGWYPAWSTLVIQSMDSQFFVNHWIVLVIGVWLPYLLMLAVVFSGGTKLTEGGR
ncbi:MAG: hypothetical protein AB1717_02730 [Pseudomonadota bacterium]